MAKNHMGVGNVNVQANSEIDGNRGYSAREEGNSLSST